jgi:PAS domain S-box-containing protein
VPDSLTDLAGLLVDAEDFLGAVLETAAQPIWVVDPDDRIRFANPAAIAALGYDSADELFGRHSHETIHHSRPDGTPYPASECRLLLPRARGETVASDLDWFFRRDGSMFPVSYVSAPIEMPDGRGAVVAFTDIEDRLHAEELRSEHEAILAAREASLRRIAARVAEGAASAEVFAAIAREVAGVLGVSLVAVWRYESDGTGTVVGAWSEPPHLLEVGSRWPLDDTVIIARVRETGRPARSDDLADVHGTVADIVQEARIRSAAGAPIVVDGDVWGVMAAGGTQGERLPDRIEDRLAGFTELVATTISNSASREELARLADEQAALRRVATLVAREAPPAEVFAAVAEELGRLLDVAATRLVRYEQDETATIVSSWGRLADEVPVGTRLPLGGYNVISLVARTGRPARIDNYAEATGPIADYGRRLNARGAVGGPIVVAGRCWGAMIVSSREAEPLPAGTEAWIEEFAELVATAIANVQARTDLAASRARVVAAADEERRRVVRDLHDGAQQRLVHTVITMKLARRALQHGDGSASALVTEAIEHAEQATADMRELAHGILPAVLTRGGLRAGVQALASRMPVPVESNVSVGRLPAGVEATAYFVVAEALTNVAKHARAHGVTVLAGVEDCTLRVRVRDDGVGGARPDGSGLVGLADRLAVLGGRLQVDSLADGGTLVAADIPLPRELPQSAERSRSRR